MNACEFAQRLAQAELTEEQFLVVNLSHARSDQYYVTFWRPDAKGYAFPLSWAGLYPRSVIEAHLDYFHSGENLAVKAKSVLPMLLDPLKGYVDGDAGPVVPNTREVWSVLCASMICAPQSRPKISPLRSARTIELVLAGPGPELPVRREAQRP